MNRSSDSIVTPTVNASLEGRLRVAGIILAHCNVRGDLISPLPGHGDWLIDLIIGSGMLRTALRNHTQRWSAEEAPRGAEICPGLWCEPVEVRRRRRRTGYGLLFIPTDRFTDDASFDALCQSASLDALAMRDTLQSMPLPSFSELPRLIMLAGDLVRHEQQSADDRRAMENISQQLAESYEEISLLYTISQSMTVVQRPQQFIRNVCCGLLDTLSYQWVGVQFISEIDSLPLLADKLIIEGRDDRPRERHGVLTRRLLTFAMPDSPVVIDPRTKPEHGEFAALGEPILIQPIAREERMVAVLFAAGKTGTDRVASSVDLKLMGATATHTGLFLENAALYEDMDAMFVGTLEAISTAIDAKDPYTHGHSRRVALLSHALAEAVGFGEETLRRVHVAGLVHDVGKIGVPEAVLSKPGRLTPEEFKLVKQHPEIGHRILKDIPQLRDVLPGVLHHHERWDGRGYPHGLSGADIPIFARLIALADSFDAMSSTRTYRQARQRRWVLEEIERCAGTQFDPDLVGAFVQLDFSIFDEMLDEHRAGEDVALHRGHAGGKAA